MDSKFRHFYFLFAVYILADDKTLTVNFVYSLMLILWNIFQKSTGFLETLNICRTQIGVFFLLREKLTLESVCGDSRDWLDNSVSSTGTIYVSFW